MSGFNTMRVLSQLTVKQSTTWGWAVAIIDLAEVRQNRFYVTFKIIPLTLRLAYAMPFGITQPGIELLTLCRLMLMLSTSGLSGPER